MTELICIVCPRGCHLSIENGVVSGNTCKKGEAFALSETTCPMRTVCTTVATAFDTLPVLPVRTDGEIPKSKIKQFMQEMDGVYVTSKLKRGDVVLENAADTGVNVVATETIK